MIKQIYSGSDMKVGQLLIDTQTKEMPKIVHV